MASLNNEAHNKSVIKNIQEHNKKLKEIKAREFELQQEEIIRDSLHSLDIRPAVNREEGNKRVEEIRKYYKKSV